MKEQKTYTGQDFSKCEVLTQPNQAMSLKEMIERFTRNEPLEVGFNVNYHESDDDLEKLRRLDPVDRAAYIKRMEEVQAKYKEQEAEAEKALLEQERAKFLEKERAKWEAEKAAQNPESGVKAK